MTGKPITLADLVPDEPVQAHAERMFARVPTLTRHRAEMAAGMVHVETLVDALDADDAALAAAAVRSLVAHVRAGRARWAELDAARRTPVRD